MNCFYCKGVETIEEGTARFCACDASTPFIVENVPASVCRLCGDKSYSGEAVDALEKIKNGECQPAGSRTVQVYDFENLSQSLDKERQPDSLRSPSGVFVSYAHPRADWATLFGAMARRQVETLPVLEHNSAWKFKRSEILDDRLGKVTEIPTSYSIKSYSINQYSHLGAQQESY
jgi:hypothetical protein